MTQGQSGPRRAPLAHVDSTDFWMCGDLCRRGAIAIWAALVAAGFAWLAHYSLYAGRAAAAPRLANADVPVAADGRRQLLVMAIHPRCPCSRASVAELTRLVTRHRSALSCAVLVFQPRGATAEWMCTSLVETVNRLPDTILVTDVDGVYAARLGMFTSGAVVLYSPLGEPEFAGGITPARGHEGDNLGSDRIGHVLTGEASVRCAPVYGCPIRGELPGGGA